MKSKAIPKIYAVYDFFLKEGFHHTVEEIASAVKLTPKTLFNRYQTKANMELSARRYWHQQIHRRILEKTSYCNNAVEKMVMLVCESLYCLRKETNYYKKEIEEVFTREENAFYVCLKQFLKEGQEAQLLNPVVNSWEYSEFFMHNLLFYFPQHPNEDTLFHLLSPVFLPVSQELYNQIDISNIIHQ